MKQVSLKRNFIMNAILTIATIVFPLITFPYISRVLLDTGVGKVSFATSVITYFCIIADLGIPTYGIRACAKVRDNKEELSRTAHELLLINLITNAVSYALLFAGVFIIPKFIEARTLILIISLTMILNAIGMEWLYKAMEQYTYITLRSIIFKVIAIIAMFFLVKSENDYIIYGGISIFAAGASNILNFINAHKFISFRPVGGINLKRHMKAVLIFFAMACATTIYTNLDIIMLGFMKTDADVGYYTAAVKVKTVLVAFITSLGAVLLPRVSYYIQNKMHDEFLRISKKAMNFVLLLSLPLMVYFIFYAKETVLLLSGEQFLPAVEPMQVIMPTLVFIGITNLMGIEILVPQGREKAVLISVVIGAVVDLIINIILIPQIGATGAAIGTVVAEGVVFIVQMAMLKDMAGKLFAEISYIKIILGIITGAGLSFWVKLLELQAFPALVISAVLFFGGYAAVQLITKEKLTVELAGSVMKKIKRS